MTRMLLVAWREFGSVVFTRGFLLGILLPPLITAVAGGAIVLMRDAARPSVAGRVVIVDQSGTTAGFALKRVPEALSSRRKQIKEAAAKEVEKATAAMNLPPEQAAQIKGMTGSQLDEQMPAADIAVEAMDPAEANIEALKETLKTSQIRAKGEGTGEAPLLAVAVIPPGATTPDAEGKFGRFDLFVVNRLDMEIQETISRGVGDAIVDARIAGDSRVKAAGFDGASLRSLLQRPTTEAVTVSSSGERKSIGPLQFLLPVGFMMLMMIAVMTTGQYLMTSVVEEKSSRVMEVLLSAVSPMQLMGGKILGHLLVGVLLVGLYGGVGVGALIAFALTNLVTPMTLVYLVCYFIVAAVSMAAMMAAIGSAVNELREAQTLMTPVMMLTMLPWMMWFFIQRAPNSTLATSLSFVPVMGPFVMVLRLGGSEPIPSWQHPVVIAIGAITCATMLWAAAKIFRVGVLMYGKPPNFATLIKWVRMA